MAEYENRGTFFAHCSYTVDLLKFRTLVAYQKGIDKKCRVIGGGGGECRPRPDCF